MSPQVADLSAYIAQQRRAIGDPDLNTGLDDRRGRPAETETQRRQRIIAGNLAGTKSEGAASTQNSGGGVFQIKRMGLDDAEFWFLGFNKDMQRRTKQLIEVSKGAYPDIHVAVVRKMIEIIREEIKGDFLWQSARLGRDLWLSARPADDQALQDTIMRDLFPDGPAGARN